MNNDEQLALQAVRDFVKKNNVGYSVRGGAIRDTGGEPEGIIHSPQQFVGLSASHEILTKDIADILMKKFPGFRWAVQPNPKGGVFNIFCLDFHSVWGYVIRHADIAHDPRRKEAVRAARELLALFRYPGSRYKPELMAQIKRNRKGEAIPDCSGMKPSRFKKKAEVEYKLAIGEARVVANSGNGQIIEITK